MQETYEEKINRLAKGSHKEHRGFTPRWPWILVRVLPKPEVAGSIILPQSKEKLSLEAIVLKTWEPFTQDQTSTFESVHSFAMRVNRRARKLYADLPEEDQPVRVTRTVEKVCDLQIGQPVTFQFYPGLPVVGYDDKYYRIVKESDIELVVDYPSGSVEVETHGKLKDIIAGVVQSGADLESNI